MTGRIARALTLVLLLMTVPLSGVAGPAAGDYPARLKRKDSFIGIHFDFHAGYDCTEVGRDVNREMVEKIIDQVHPDYVQCDCKGHPGLSSYPTKVGYPAPGFVRDPLRIWREVTAERGVALYMHYSGVWDAEAVKHHPGWALVDANGRTDPQAASVFGPYADSLLIPQVRELIDVYGVDGIWIDGDCWAVAHDYSDRALELFRKETGITSIPRQPGDPYYLEYTEFCRQGFRDYLKHYVSEIHRYKPDFQVASNWAYSSMMPEPVEAEVDFISGDYSLRNSVNTARFEGRGMVHQGKAWDLMAWAFTVPDTEYSTKSVPQLEQEAAIVISLGGGFQAYFPQKRDGSVRLWQMELMGRVAQFCRERREFCHGAQPVPQVGLLFSRANFYRNSERLFSHRGPEVARVRGILQCLLDSQNPVEVVEEHQMAGRLDEYPLIIVPESNYLEPEFRDSLLAYVARGGRLLAVGPGSAALFEKELRVRLAGAAVKRWNGLDQSGWLAGLLSFYQDVELGEGATAFGRIYSDNDYLGPYRVAGSIADYGKGRIAATYLDFGQAYLEAATAVARDYLNALVRELFPEPLVEVKGSRYVDVVVNRIGGKLAVNLVNTAGPHADEKVHVFDEVPPVGPLEVAVRCSARPRRVRLEPEGRDLQFSFAEGIARITLPKLEIHEIIMIE
ncbi:MAG: alpha-amylase family protein [Candidatus Glassbacteria bacterium]